MENEKNAGAVVGTGPKEGEFMSDASSSRARNRTVMLTPEITGQVRARLAQELDPNQTPAGASSSGGFETPASRAFSMSGALSGTSAPLVEPRSSGATIVPRADASRADSAPREQYVAPAPESRTPQVSGNRGISWSKETPVVGFLVSYDATPNGDIFVLRSGRLMVTSEGGTTDNCLLIQDESVSPMHAVMRIGGDGEIQVLDQLSEFGTSIKRSGADVEERLSGDKGVVHHGDRIKFGNRAFSVCLVAREVG